GSDPQLLHPAAAPVVRVNDLSRRELLKTAGAVPLLSAFGRAAQTRHPLGDIAPPRVSVATVRSRDDGRTVGRRRHPDTCRSHIINTSKVPIRAREVVLADVELGMPASTGVYGESFQMLSQSGGTLGAPKDLGSYTDAKHYRIPMADGGQTYF